ncbi:MAG: heavy-metal-associated domain-containing protein [Flavobacterium sp.]|nr:heavy-metal-associated domain-containing protein [Flavobacterium sp.]
MNLHKIIFTSAFSIVLIVGCKDKGSKATNEIQSSDNKKEIVVAVKPQTASFTIDGMICPDGCAKTIEKKLSEMKGVQNAKVDFEKKQATINFDLDKLKSEDLVNAVEETGDGKTYKVSNLKTVSKS